MNKDLEKHFWRQAWLRFQGIDWEGPVSEAQVDALHAALAKRQTGESIGQWLQRTLIANALKFNPFTQIIRRVASSGGLEDYPLPDCDFLLTEDESLRFSIKGERGTIFIKVEALGLAIETLANRVLGIAYKSEAHEIVAMIVLDVNGEGEVCVADTLAMRRALSNPLIGLME